MHTDLHSLQIAAMAIVFALIFSARLVKGHPRHTPAGLVFPLKPLVVFSRAIALPLYFLLFAYPLWISRQSIPPWLLILMLVAVLFGLYQYPGTIVLTPTGVTQRFWFRAHKAIAYPEIMNDLSRPQRSRHHHLRQQPHRHHPHLQPRRLSRVPRRARSPLRQTSRTLKLIRPNPSASGKAAPHPAGGCHPPPLPHAAYPLPSG